MAITLTGSKSSGTLSAVGTYSVTVSTTPFSSGDYSVSRYAVLFTSAGAFKGIARVRRYVSTSSLDLMTEFYDPVNGAAMAQAVGDVVHISKNFAECVTAGLTYSAGSVVATDQLVFGTAGSQTSLVLHDESCQLVSTYSGAAACDFLGGVCIFGHQTSPGSSDVVGACTFVANTAYASPYTVLQVSNAAVNLFCFGGGVGKVVAATTTILHITVNVSPASLVFVSATIPSIATYAGSATIRHVLQNCVFEQVKTTQVLIRWKTGIISGGHARVNPGFASYCIFGEDTAGAYSRRSDPNKRFVVVDSSATYPMVRSATAVAQVWSFTNTVAVSKRHVYSTSTPNPSGTGLYYYQDAYTNIVSGSIAQVRLNSDSSLEDSTLSTGTSWSPSVLRDSWTGATQNAGFPHGPWTYGIKRYGYAPVSGAIAASNYDLGAAGTADNVAFGGAVVQAPDTSVTLSESAALALATIDTYDALYDALIAWNCASVANAAYPSLGAYPCTSGGGVINLGTLDLVVDATAASTLAVNTSTDTVTIKSSSLGVGSTHTSLVTAGTVSAINGAELTGIYTDSTGTHVTVTAAAIVAGSRVQLYNVTDATELLNTTLGSTGLAYATTWTADKTIRLRADHPDYLPLEASGILTASGLTFLATQAEDTVYVGNGIDGSTVTEFAADVANIQIDVSDPDGVTNVQRLYAWLQHYQTTSAGVASPFFGAMSAADSANYRIDATLIDLKLDNVSGSPVVIAGGYLYRSDGATVIAATSGSIQMDPGRAYVAPGGAAITVPDGERVILLQASGAHIARG